MQARHGRRCHQQQLAYYLLLTTDLLYYLLTYYLLLTTYLLTYLLTYTYLLTLTYLSLTTYLLTYFLAVKARPDGSDVLTCACSELNISAFSSSSSSARSVGLEPLVHARMMRRASKRVTAVRLLRTTYSRLSTHHAYGSGSTSGCRSGSSTLPP